MTNTSPLRRIALPFIAMLPALAGCTLEEREADGPEPIGEAVQAVTVAQAASSSCSTTSVKGLSEQIVDQSNCIATGTFVKVPVVGGLVFGAAAFPYLELPAKNAFIKAVNSTPGTTLTVSSMLRTVAQQYLLYNWSVNGKCGVGLAAKPGASDHETGLAVDIQQYSTWKSTLEGNGFQWFGDDDAVHFDYVGAGTIDSKGTDVKAFQQLWNKNNPGDQISEDGAYGAQTEARLKQSPADGFAKGADCDAPKSDPDIHPSITLVSEEDRFFDGASAGVSDIFEGEVYSFRLEVVNKGGSGASNIDVGVFIEEPYLAATDYIIESDWMNGGTFKESDDSTDPANPEHGEPLGASFSLKLSGLSPQETKRITLTVSATNYSIGLTDSPEVRLWVKDIPNFYHQDEFNGEAQNTNTSQTFGDKLQVFWPTDVYSRARWEWDSDRLEGWTPLGSATLTADPAAKVLLIGGEGDAPGALGPTTSFSASELVAVALRAKRTGGQGGAKLYFTTSSEPSVSEEKTIDFDLPDDDGFHEIVVRAADNARWSGTITSLRIDPFSTGPGTVEIDYVRAVGADGSIGSGGMSSGSGTGGSGAASSDGSEAACACALPGANGTNGKESRGGAPWSMLAVFAASAARAARRRHR